MLSDKEYSQLLHDVKRFAVTLDTIKSSTDKVQQSKLIELSNQEIMKMVEDLERIKDEKNNNLESLLAPFGKYKFCTYLIGSMEKPADNDGGVAWREELKPELTKRGIYVFDPTREELEKVGMPSEELMQKLTGWQLSGNWKSFIEHMQLIWKGKSQLVRDGEDGATRLIHIFGDVDYVERSRFLIWRLKEGDRPGGTILELAIAWYRGIPVYLLTDVPKSKINKSILYAVLDSGYGEGRVFSHKSALLEYIDVKHNLKEGK
jgi:hypothetical protein